jgi:tetratricopeptide (TPR) repeat protein
MGRLYDKEAQMHYESGQSHESANDFVEARHQYCGAMSRGERAGEPKATMAMLTYDCGRASGYVCDFPNAEKYLLKSLELQREVGDPNGTALVPRIMELARVYSDRGNYAESAKYFAMGIPILESLGVEQHDPLAYADAVDEYGDMLAHIGEAADSSAQKAKALSIRKNHPNARKGFVPVRCKGTR